MTRFLPCPPAPRSPVRQPRTATPTRPCCADCPGRLPSSPGSGQVRPCRTQRHPAPRRPPSAAARSTPAAGNTATTSTAGPSAASAPGLTAPDAGDRAVPAGLPSSWVGVGAPPGDRGTFLHGVLTSLLIAAAVALAAAAAGLLLQPPRTTTK